jgi:hypothetical protein
MNLEVSIKLGLQLFPSDEGCGFATAPGVPVAPSNYLAIASLLDATNPAGGTPTRRSLESGTAYMAGLADPQGGDKVILLVTDGEPNCNYPQPCTCGSGYTPNAAGTSCCRNGDCNYFCNGGDQLDDQGTGQVCAQAAAAGIPVYVIGMAAGLGNVLDYLAVSGGRPRPMGPPYYYEATSASQLEAAMNEIAADIIPCSFPLQRQPPAPDDIDVLLNGVPVPRDPINGWSLSPDLMSIIFNGSACTNLQSLGQTADIQVTLNCPPIG